MACLYCGADATHEESGCPSFSMTAVPHGRQARAALTPTSSWWVTPTREAFRRAHAAEVPRLLRVPVQVQKNREGWT